MAEPGFQDSARAFSAASVAVDTPSGRSSPLLFAQAYAPLIARWRADADRRMAELEAIDRATRVEPAPAGPIAPLVDSRRIDRFCRLMALEGWAVHADRVKSDPEHARELLRLGLGSASADLRRLALEIYRLYEARQAWH